MDFDKIADKYSYKGVINTVNINADKYFIFGTKINKSYGLSRFYRKSRRGRSN